MPLVELPFANGFYISASNQLIEERAVNVFPVIPEADASSNKVLFHTPGISEFADVTTGTSRGAIRFIDGTPYRVIGSTLYSFDSVGNKTAHGTITGTADVSMSSNGINICIVVPEGQSYFFTPSLVVLETILDAGFLAHGEATSVTFKDGFYVFTTDTVFFSSSDKTTNDGKNFNALDFLDAGISPDKITKCFVDHNQLYIGGESTAQVYRTIVTSGFPFEIIDGAILEKGFTSRNAVVKFDKSFLFLGGGENEKVSVYQAVGSSYEKVSTRAIDRLIQANSACDIANARAFSYGEDGDFFAVFTVGNNTLVYSQQSVGGELFRSWHERQTGITNGEGFQKWRAVHGLLAFNKIQVGDDRSGKVGELDNSIFDEYGAEIEKIWSTKPFTDKASKVFSETIQLHMQVGIGNDDIADPQIRMDYSDNGSQTFNNEITKSLGKIGEFEREIEWRRLGQFKKTRVLRWKTTVKAPINVYGLFANVKGKEGG